MRKIISLLMAASLLPLMTGCTASADERIGEAEGYGGNLRVKVAMQDGDITKVEVIEHHETQGVGTRAIDALPKLIEDADHIGVDSVSGATVTSEAIKKAVSNALGDAGVIQQVIPMDNENASDASARPMLGVGMAVNGRTGPGKDDAGKQVYSVNVVFASGEFGEDGVIRAIRVDQLEILSPNKGSGNLFSGFPADEGGAEAFMQEVSGWQTKGALGESYMMNSGSWRTQMDAYEQMMVGKTVEEVRAWYEEYRGSSAETPAETGTEAPAATEDAAAAATMDASSSATMSLSDEHGDILLAIERAWEDAQRGQDNSGLTDKNTVEEGGQGTTEMG